MIVLGISAFYHDSAAAIIRDGKIVAAAQEERFSRIKADEGFPRQAVEFCLDWAGVTLDEVDFVGFYDKPFLTFSRLVETYLAFAPKGFLSFAKAMPVWVKEKIFQKSLLRKNLNDLGKGSVREDQILFSYHHHSHAASAYYPSPFDEAAILVMDGVGEWATTSLGFGKGNEIQLLKELRFPHSLGLLYSAFTTYLGFKVNDGEYKVMGLAPYGEPKYADLIRDNIITIKDDGSFRLHMEYFNYCTGFSMTNDRFADLFGAPALKPGAPLTQHEMDIARSIQEISEEIILKLCRNLHAETGQRNLCMAGGVALNCVANGRIRDEGPFENIWIQPASGDAGGALGVALSISRLLDPPAFEKKTGAGDDMQGAYLGPAFDADEIRNALDRFGASYRELDGDELFRSTAKALADEMVVGWFQGRMEFGPRALGNRSILGDARSSRMQRMLNMKIKYRESFRPFAPAVLSADAGDYFELAGDSPYMLLVSSVNGARRRGLTDAEAKTEGLEKLNISRSDIPAVTHVDNSARIQTVHADTNPRFHRLLETFKDHTGYGILVNTSFNVRDEPIVRSPDDAYYCFMASEMDVLVLENFVLRKQDQ